MPENDAQNAVPKGDISRNTITGTAIIAMIIPIKCAHIVAKRPDS